MQKLPEVEEAKALMTEAMDWSVFTWLFQKRRVRETADRANAALDALNLAVKQRWPAETKTAYRHLSGGSRRKGNGAASSHMDEETRALVEQVKVADDLAHRARMTAEDTFDEAERQLNTNLAREGCRQAIHSWELHEKAIRKAEAGLNHGAK
jgi:hypothetical protein